MKRKSMENKRHRATEPNFSKKSLRWRFPLGPGKTFLTLLGICIFAFSLSADAAWLIGYRYMIFLLYFGAFFSTLMLTIDAAALIDYFKCRKNVHGSDPGSEETKPEKENNKDTLEKTLRWLTAQRYARKQNVIKMPREERDKLIRVYEKLYPADADTIASFFDRFQKKSDYDYTEDIENIKYIIYTAESCQRNTIIKYLPAIHITQLRENVFSMSEKYDYYWNTISIRLSDRKDLSKLQNPYGVFFHELSHAIDDVTCPDRIFMKNTVNQYKNEKGEHLQDIARREAKKHVADTIRTCAELSGQDFPKEKQERLLEDIFSPDTNQMTFSDADIEIIYQMVRRVYGYSEYEKEQKKIFLHKGTAYQLYQRRYNAVSDVLGGYTANTVGACPTGHFLPYYWYNLLGKETKRQARELWAEYSAYLITGDKEAIEGTEEFFPESCEMIRSIWKDFA